MTEANEVEAPPVTPADVDTTDRRRPGRLEHVSPTLIPILRNADPEVGIEFECDDIDQAAAARGVAVGLLLSAPFWVAIAYLGTWFLS